jgi:hypothetical protein
MAFRGDLAIEPGYGRGLTIVSGVVGVGYTIDILGWMDAHLAAGIGIGGFGVHAPAEALGLAIDTSMGLRFRFDHHLAVRVDVLPTLVIPANGVTVGGHISTVVRGELRF